jgi:regulator of sigma D
LLKRLRILNHSCQAMIEYLSRQVFHLKAMVFMKLGMWFQVANTMISKLYDVNDPTGKYSFSKVVTG